MIEDIPILSIEVKILKYFAILDGHNWRRYFLLVPICILNFFQLLYIVEKWGNVNVLILNIAFFSGILISIVRTLTILKNRNNFLRVLNKVAEMYTELEENGNEQMKNFLKITTKNIRNFTKVNWGLLFLAMFGVLIFPFVLFDRAHPFGVWIPGVDFYSSPTYELVYLFEIFSISLFPIMFMPFTTFFLAWITFCIALLKILKHELKTFYDAEQPFKINIENIGARIQLHNFILSLVADLNSLYTYNCLFEFLMFGIALCALLFSLNIATSPTEFGTVVLFICVTLFYIFNFFRKPSELQNESFQLAEVIYDLPWPDYPVSIQKIVLLMLMRSQRPLQIMMGNLYPMNMETFTSLLNASYSYFTFLRHMNE